MNRFDLRFRTLHLSTALLLLACPSDDAAGDGSDTEATTGPSTSSPSTSSPSTSSPSTSSPSTSATETDPSDTDPSDTDTDPSDTDASSSSGEPSGCQVEPGEWAAPNWADNTTVEAGARQALTDLSGGLMRGAEQGTKGAVVEDLEDLTTQYMAGDPSLASLANPGFQPIVDSAFAEFVDVIAAGDVTLVDTETNEWTPGLAGGIWGTSFRGINEGGIEVRQIVEKGLFGGGAFYGHALSLTEGEIDEATIDRIAYIWGSNETHEPVDESTKPPTLLIVHSASYGFRHGFFGPIVDALTAAKAYAADAECVAERDAALQEVFAQWEMSLMARCVHYSNETAIALSTAATQDQFAGTLHGLAECMGLFAGFYGLPEVEAGPLAGASRTLTDADIDLMFAAYGIDPTNLGDSTTGEFVESLPNFEAAVEEFEGVVMDAYGVDAATIAMWRTVMEG
jgi:hypothetical protein